MSKGLPDHIVFVFPVRRLAQFPFYRKYIEFNTLLK